MDFSIPLDGKIVKINKSQIDLFSQEVVNKLQKKSKVILSKIDSLDWQSNKRNDPNVPDLTNIASYVECTTTMPNAIICQMKKKTKKNSRKNRDQLLRIFGSLLEDIEVGTTILPKKLNKERRYSLPVSINKDLFVPTLVSKVNTAVVCELPPVEFTIPTEFPKEKMDFRFVSSTVVPNELSVARSMAKPHTSSRTEVVKNNTLWWPPKSNQESASRTTNLSMPLLSPAVEQTARTLPMMVTQEVPTAVPSTSERANSTTGQTARTLPTMVTQQVPTAVPSTSERANFSSGQTVRTLPTMVTQQVSTTVPSTSVRTNSIPGQTARTLPIMVTQEVSTTVPSTSVRTNFSSGQTARTLPIMVTQEVPTAVPSTSVRTNTTPGQTAQSSSITITPSVAPNTKQQVPTAVPSTSEKANSVLQEIMAELKNQAQKRVETSTVSPSGGGVVAEQLLSARTKPRRGEKRPAPHPDFQRMSQIRPSMVFSGQQPRLTYQSPIQPVSQQSTEPQIIQQLLRQQPNQTAPSAGQQAIRLPNHQNFRIQPAPHQSIVQRPEPQTPIRQLLVQQPNQTGPQAARLPSDQNLRIQPAPQPDLQRMSQMRPPYAFSGQQQNQTGPPAPKLIRLSFPIQNCFNSISIAEFANKLFPHLYTYTKWRANACKYRDNMITFLEERTFKENYEAFTVYVLHSEKTFGKKMIQDFQLIDVNPFNMDEVLKILNRKLLEKSVSMSKYGICSFLYRLLTGCKDHCSTPFTMAFFNNVTAAMKRMQAIFQQGSSIITPGQILELQDQITHYLMTENWLNRRAAIEAYDRRAAIEAYESTQARQPTKSQIHTVSQNALSRPVSAVAEKQPTPEKPSLTVESTSPPSVPVNISTPVSVPPSPVCANQVPTGAIQLPSGADQVPVGGTNQVPSGANQVPVGGTNQVPTEITSQVQSALCCKPEPSANDWPVIVENPNFRSTSALGGTEAVIDLCDDDLPINNESKEGIKMINFGTDEVIDLTWIDNGDEAEIIEEFAKHREFLPVVESDESSREVVSPADSGLGSPTLQTDRDDYKCLCGEKATYICACKLSMYCSRDCQISDWPEHQRWCKSNKT